MIRCFFWDFDGTLYDSYPEVNRTMMDGLRDFHLEGLFDEKEVAQLVKHNLWRAAEYFSEKTAIPPEEFLLAYRRHQEEHRNFLPYPGMGDCLKALHEAGAMHFLYTHRDRHAVDRLTADGLWPLFTDAITREDGFPDKPAPDALLSLAHRYELPVQECVMVGDRDIDILAGKNAGMATILFDPDNFFPDVETDWRLGSMAELQAAFLPLPAFPRAK